MEEAELPTAFVALRERQLRILNSIDNLSESFMNPAAHNLITGPPPNPKSRDALGNQMAACNGETVEQRLSNILEAGGATGFLFKRVPSDYYQRSFEERRDLLGAASVDQLCKSIVMVNTQASEKVIDCSDRNNSKYYVIIVQFTTRLNAEKVKAFVHSLNEGKLSKKKFNMRLAPEEESNKLTGFEHNAVTPIGMRTDIPVILSEAIARLNPEFFWLGGGEVDLKLGIKTQDFIRIVKPFITDCIY